jgi:hypothetical protein
MDLNILNAAENPIPTHAYAAFLAVILGGSSYQEPRVQAPTNTLGILGCC